MNRKLNQKIVNLKTQLEKEKNKNNKNNNLIKSNITKRGITNEKTLNNKDKVKQRNNCFISKDTTKKKFLNRSMDKMKKNNNLNNNKNILSNENRETENNEEKLFKNKSKELLIKEQNRLSDLIKEKKGIGNNSDCTNFSDANNDIAE